ncbi:MAG: sugar phosphate isomerase/epimerase [Mucilaginibacter sp.]
MGFNIVFINTNWGKKRDIDDAEIAVLRKDGYSGLEVNVASSGMQKSVDIVDRLGANDFIFIAQQWQPTVIESVDQYIERLKINLDNIAALNPRFINSHTGKDFYSFDDNCRVIDIIEQFSIDTGIPVYHETHRGRFAFHASGMLPYLKAFPSLQLTADFSHWCTVSESMLQNQQEIIDQIIPHVKYIHARIGHEEAPQVNDPAAPEWADHVQYYYNWWDSIIKSNKTDGRTEICICPEFGPVPYMPTKPYTKEPIADQDAVNLWMLRQLENRYSGQVLLRPGVRKS